MDCKDYRAGYETDQHIADQVLTDEDLAVHQLGSFANHVLAPDTSDKPDSEDLQPLDLLVVAVLVMAALILEIALEAVLLALAED